MSTKYKNGRDVPLGAIIARLKELSDAVTGGRESQGREFTMRIPAECDRDADLVIGEAAVRLSKLQAENEVLRARVAELEAKAMQVGFDYSQAFILRKQADAAEEAIVFALRTAGNVDPFEVNMHKFANDYAQRLHQQADEAEKAGGEK